MHKKGLTQAEIGLTQPENRSNSNFRTSTCLDGLAEKVPKKTPEYFIHEVQNEKPYLGEKCFAAVGK